MSLRPMDIADLTPGQLLSAARMADALLKAGI